MESKIKIQKYGFFITIAALFLFITPEIRCLTYDAHQKEFKIYQRKFQILNNQIRRLDAKIKSKLTIKQRIILNKKLQSHIRQLHKSFNKLRYYSAKLRFRKRKFTKFNYTLPDRKMNRLVPLCQAAVDYVIMMAMKSQYNMEGANNKDVLARILVALKEME